MSATNQTTHYELPSFLGSDKPAWLVDWNGAMATIDAAIYEAKTVADGAAAAATTNASNISTLQTTVSGIASDLGTVSTSLTSLQGTVNTITSLIGNGEPTTTDKTIIGAINEINAYTAADIGYDNTISGLTASNVKAAIDEVTALIGDGYEFIGEVRHRSQHITNNTEWTSANINLDGADVVDSLADNELLLTIGMIRGSGEFSAGIRKIITSNSDNTGLRNFYTLNVFASTAMAVNVFTPAPLIMYYRFAADGITITDQSSDDTTTTFDYLFLKFKKETP